MKRLFVDTNVFLRFLTEDDAGQCEQAGRLLSDAAAGRVGLVTGPPVLFELYWTLRRGYRLPRGRAIEILSSVLAVDGLEVTDRALVEAALDRAKAADQEFADAYIAASADAARVDAVATFNERDFERLGAVCFSWSREQG